MSPWVRTIGNMYCESLAIVDASGSVHPLESIREWLGNRCAICGIPAAWDLVVDHDHKTGKVRGLLCRSCNTLEGMASDSIKDWMGERDLVLAAMWRRYRTTHNPAALLGISDDYASNHLW